MGLDKDNNGVAFALVIFAGGATAIGSAAVFFPRLGVKLANRRTLAASLGLASGVMIYVSLVDIYQKGVAGFADQGHTDEKAFIYTTICFFCGCILMMILNKLVDLLIGLDSGGHIVHDEFDPEATREITSVSENLMVHAHKPSKSDDPVKQANHLNRMLTELEGDASSGADNEESGQNEMPANDHADNQDDEAKVKAQARLFHVGAATALAIAIHNLPEGLLTFIVYKDDPAVGVALAVGIAIHNIPEGLCVSMPLYYATGKRWNSFWWGVLSGVSEPLGALIGWGVLNSSFSGNTYGIMFGLVSGIMAYISLDELLPTAHRYDPNNTVVTKTLLIGMFAIALSLMLFSI